MGRSFRPRIRRARHRSEAERMAKKKTDPAPEDGSDRCLYQRKDHWALNYSDGPMVSGVGLVCPTATFIAFNRDKLAVAAHRGFGHAVILQQCEDFLVEQFESQRAP